MKNIGAKIKEKSNKVRRKRNKPTNILSINRKGGAGGKIARQMNRTQREKR
jgi:hypothetical protein